MTKSRMTPRKTSAGVAAGTSGDSRKGGATRERRLGSCGALTPSDIERLKQLEEDYSKLKQIVAGLDLD